MISWPEPASPPVSTVCRRRRPCVTTHTKEAPASLRTASRGASTTPSPPGADLRLAQERDAHAHVRAKLLIGLEDLRLDLEGALLSVDLRVELHDGRAISPIGVGVGDDLDGLPDLDLREVRFVDVDLGAQLVHVRQADQLARPGEAARHGDLPHLLELLEHHPVRRRAQHRVLEVELELGDPRDQSLHLRLGDAQLVLLHVEIGLRRDVAAVQLLRAVQLLAPEVQIGARQVQARARLLERCRVVAVVEAHQGLPRHHRLAFVDEVLLDAAGNPHAERDVAITRHHVPRAREHGPGLARARRRARRVGQPHLRSATEGRPPGEVAAQQEDQRDRDRHHGPQPGRPRRSPPAAAVDAQRRELVAHRAVLLARFGAHALRSASTGRSRDARSAGKIPPTRPMKRESARAIARSARAHAELDHVGREGLRREGHTAEEVRDHAPERPGARAAQRESEQRHHDRFDQEGAEDRPAGEPERAQRADLGGARLHGRVQRVGGAEGGARPGEHRQRHDDVVEHVRRLRLLRVVLALGHRLERIARIVSDPARQRIHVRPARDAHAQAGVRNRALGVVPELAHVTPDLALGRGAAALEDAHHLPGAAPELEPRAELRAQVAALDVAADDHLAGRGLEHPPLDDLHLVVDGERDRLDAAHQHVLAPAVGPS